MGSKIARFERDRSETVLAIRSRMSSMSPDVTRITKETPVKNLIE